MRTLEEEVHGKRYDISPCLVAHTKWLMANVMVQLPEADDDSEELEEIAHQKFPTLPFQSEHS
jgi:hypothetical protein